jgi:hypothetical protein
MDVADRVSQRLERIESLGRRSTATPALLDELRALVRDAEALAREGGEPPSPPPKPKFERGRQE